MLKLNSIERKFNAERDKKEREREKDKEQSRYLAPEPGLAIGLGRATSFTGMMSRLQALQLYTKSGICISESLKISTSSRTRIRKFFL